MKEKIISKTLIDSAIYFLSLTVIEMWVNFEKFSMYLTYILRNNVRQNFISKALTVSEVKFSLHHERSSEELSKKFLLTVF